MAPLEAPPLVSPKTEGPPTLVGNCSSENPLQPVIFCKSVLIVLRGWILNIQSSIHNIVTYKFCKYPTVVFQIEQRDMATAETLRAAFTKVSGERGSFSPF